MAERFLMCCGVGSKNEHVYQVLGIVQQSYDSKPCYIIFFMFTLYVGPSQLAR